MKPNPLRSLLLPAMVHKLHVECKPEYPTAVSSANMYTCSLIHGKQGGCWCKVKTGWDQGESLGVFLQSWVEEQTMLSPHEPGVSCEIGNLWTTCGCWVCIGFAALLAGCCGALCQRLLQSRGRWLAIWEVISIGWSTVERWLTKPNSVFQTDQVLLVQISGEVFGNNRIQRQLGTELQAEGR